ncbi:LemA family protein [compost metagenome]
MSDSLVSDLNDKINFSLDNYNQTVRVYNVYRITFPNSLIARKTQFSKNFNYFDYRYGVGNEKKMIKKRKVENWIKNGGPYPE